MVLEYKKIGIFTFYEADWVDVFETRFVLEDLSADATI